MAASAPPFAGVGSLPSAAGSALSDEGMLLSLGYLSSEQRALVRHVFMKQNGKPLTPGSDGLSYYSRVLILDAGPEDVFPADMILSFNQIVHEIDEYLTSHGLHFTASAVPNGMSKDDFIYDFCQKLQSKPEYANFFIKKCFELSVMFILSARNTLLETVPQGAHIEKKLGIQYRMQSWLKQCLISTRAGGDQDEEYKNQVRQLGAFLYGQYSADKKAVKERYPGILFENFNSNSREELLILGEHYLANAMVLSYMQSAGSLDTFFTTAQLYADSVGYIRYFFNPVKNLFKELDLVGIRADLEKVFNLVGHLIGKEMAVYSSSLFSRVNEIEANFPALVMNNVLYPVEIRSEFTLCGALWKEVESLPNNEVHRIDFFNRIYALAEIMRTKEGNFQARFSYQLSSLLVDMLEFSRPERIKRIQNLADRYFSNKVKLESEQLNFDQRAIYQALDEMVVYQDPDTGVQSIRDFSEVGNGASRRGEELLSRVLNLKNGEPLPSFMIAAMEQGFKKIQDVAEKQGISLEGLNNPNNLNKEILRSLLPEFVELQKNLLDGARKFLLVNVKPSHSLGMKYQLQPWVVDKLVALKGFDAYRKDMIALGRVFVEKYRRQPALYPDLNLNNVRLEEKDYFALGEYYLASRMIDSLLKAHPLMSRFYVSCGVYSVPCAFEQFLTNHVERVFNFDFAAGDEHFSSLFEECNSKLLSDEQLNYLFSQMEVILPANVEPLIERNANLPTEGRMLRSLLEEVRKIKNVAERDVSINKLVSFAQLANPSSMAKGFEPTLFVRNCKDLFISLVDKVENLSQLLKIFNAYEMAYDAPNSLMHRTLNQVQANSVHRAIADKFFEALIAQRIQLNNDLAVVDFANFVKDVVLFRLKAVDTLAEFSRVFAEYIQAFQDQNSVIYQVMSRSEAQNARDEILDFVAHSKFAGVVSKVTRRGFSVGGRETPVGKLIQELRSAYANIPVASFDQEGAGADLPSAAETSVAIQARNVASAMERVNLNQSEFFTGSNEDFAHLRQWKDEEGYSLSRRAAQERDPFLYDVLRGAYRVGGRDLKDLYNERFPLSPLNDNINIQDFQGNVRTILSEHFAILAASSAVDSQLASLDIPQDVSSIVVVQMFQPVLAGFDPALTISNSDVENTAVYFENASGKHLKVAVPITQITLMPGASSVGAQSFNVDCRLEYKVNFDDESQQYRLDPNSLVFYGTDSKAFADIIREARFKEDELSVSSYRRFLFEIKLPQINTVKEVQNLLGAYLNVVKDPLVRDQDVPVFINRAKAILEQQDAVKMVSSSRLGVAKQRLKMPEDIKAFDAIKKTVASIRRNARHATSRRTGFSDVMASLSGLFSALRNGGAWLLSSVLSSCFGCAPRRAPAPEVSPSPRLLPRGITVTPLAGQQLNPGAVVGLPRKRSLSGDSQDSRNNTSSGPEVNK